MELPQLLPARRNICVHACLSASEDGSWSVLSYQRAGLGTVWPESGRRPSLNFGPSVSPSSLSFFECHMGREQVIKVVAVGRGQHFAELKAAPEGAAIVAPTWTPAQLERNMNTRAAASSLERRQRTMQVCVPFCRTHPLLPRCTVIIVRGKVRSCQGYGGRGVGGQVLG